MYVPVEQKITVEKSLFGKEKVKNGDKYENAEYLHFSTGTNYTTLVIILSSRQGRVDIFLGIVHHLFGVSTKSFIRVQQLVANANRIGNSLICSFLVFIHM